MFEFLDLSDATTEERTQAMAIIQSVAPGIEVNLIIKHFIDFVY